MGGKLSAPGMHGVQVGTRLTVQSAKAGVSSRLSARFRRFLPFLAGTGLLLIGQLAPNPAFALELPAGPYGDLSSEDFQTRETAQGKLLDWARKSKVDTTDGFFRLSRTAPEPEPRERCLAILRELVIDEYLKEGEGYIGIRMQPELGQVPGDPKPRALIRVTEVMPDSAAEKAGLRLNDLIAGLNEQVWRDESATLAFTDKVRQFKPNTRVALKVLREGALMDVEVVLGRRPLIPDNPFLDPRQFDLDAIERVARDAYFRRWLEDKKSRD